MCSVLFSNELTVGGLLGGDWSPEIPSLDFELGIFNPTLHSTERGEGPEIELMMDHAYMIKPRKNPQSTALRLVNTWRC